MGTVGLSFGSATSGQGFDVASTVAQIQAANQAIETPWQNQLTALKAQDTVLSSIGTDLSALSTSLQKLTDFEGIFAEKQGSSSNPDVLSLSSASSSASAGSHTIVVSQLAQTSSDVSSAIASASDTLTGTVTIQGHLFDTSTGSSNTLTGLVSAINSAAIGVTASVITDSTGSRLSIVSNTSGTAGQLSAIATNNLADSTTGSGNVSFSSGEQGQDANLTVDGVAATSSSNTVTNLIAGVTFQLLATSATPVQVQITDGTTDIATAIGSFVSAYNKVVGDVDSVEQSGSGASSAPLLGSPVIAQLQESLTGSLFGSAASGSINNITQLGLTVNNDGTLALNSDTLTSVLDSHLSDVAGFLQNSGSFGQKLATALNNAGTQAPNGAVFLAQQQNSSQETALNADITNENAVLATQKTQLTDELNAANQILQSIPEQLNEVNSVFDSLTGFTPNTQA